MSYKWINKKEMWIIEKAKIPQQSGATTRGGELFYLNIKSAKPLKSVLPPKNAEHKNKADCYKKIWGRKLNCCTIPFIMSDKRNMLLDYSDWSAEQRQRLQREAQEEQQAQREMQQAQRAQQTYHTQAYQAPQTSFTGPVQTRSTYRNQQTLPGSNWQPFGMSEARPQRQNRLYAQATNNATANATDATPNQQPELNEWGYYRPEAAEFDYVERDSRGYRNHNLGNITYDRRFRWEGAVGVDERGFIIFANDHYGIRAMTRNISNQQVRNGRNNIQELLGGYAPPGEDNPTQEYINFVAGQMGVNATERIDMSDPETLERLMGAMIRFENGRNQIRPEHMQNAIRDGLHRQ